MVRRIFLNPETPGDGEESPQRPRTVREIMDTAPSDEQTQPDAEQHSPEQDAPTLRMTLDETVSDLPSERPESMHAWLRQSCRKRRHPESRLILGIPGGWTFLMNLSKPRAQRVKPMTSLRKRLQIGSRLPTSVQKF